MILLENTSEDHAVQSLFLTLCAECNYRLIALLSTNQNRVIVHSIWLGLANTDKYLKLCSNILINVETNKNFLQITSWNLKYHSFISLIYQITWLDDQSTLFLQCLYWGAFMGCVGGFLGGSNISGLWFVAVIYQLA